MQRENVWVSGVLCALVFAGPVGAQELGELEPLPEEPAPEEPSEPEDPGTLDPKDPDAPTEEPSDPHPPLPPDEAEALGLPQLNTKTSRLSGPSTAINDGLDLAELVLHLEPVQRDDLLVGLRVTWEISGSGNQVVQADPALQATTGEARLVFTSTVAERKTVTATVTRGTISTWVFTHRVTFQPPMPRVESVSPSQGPLTGGNTVTIQGAHLADPAAPTQVAFGDAPAVVLSAVPDEVRVVAPPAAAIGAVDVHVTVGDHTDTALGSYEYVVISSETCTHLSGSDRLVALADVDGDGDLDFLTTGRQPVFKRGVQVGTELALGIVRNSGDGGRILPAVWWTLSDEADAVATSLEVADVDGDGAPEVVVALSGAQIDRPLRVFYGLQLTSVRPLPLAYPAGAGFGERLPDVALGAYAPSGLEAPRTGSLAVATAAGVEVLTLQGEGSAPLHTTYGSGPVLAVEMADVTGDGILDVVSLGADTLLRVWVGDGQGGFTAGVVSPAGGSARGLALGDLDGDGLPDAIVAAAPEGQTHYTGYLRVYRNDGAGGFATAPFELAVPDLGTSIAVGELTGDGVLDLAVCGGGAVGLGADVLLVPGSGDGTLGDPVVVGEAPTAGAVRISDVTGDGEADVVVKAQDALCVHATPSP